MARNLAYVLLAPLALWVIAAIASHAWHYVKHKMIGRIGHPERPSQE